MPTNPTTESVSKRNDLGFSLIETVIALVIIMIALLGVFAVFTYAITYNAGNKARAQAVAVMQQEVERYRSAKFNSTTTDNFASPAEPGLCRTDGLRDLRGRRESKCRVVANDGSGLTFIVSTIVDDDPSVANTPAPPNLDIPQENGYVCLSPQGAAIPCAIKEITIEVKLAAPSPGWQTAIPVRTVLRRVRGN